MRERNFHCIHKDKETIKQYPSGLKKLRCLRCRHIIMELPSGERIQQASFIDVLLGQEA